MNYIEKTAKLILLKKKLAGKPILNVTGEGCQARGDFNWIGKVVGFKTKDDNEYAIIKIIKHHQSYTDSRDENQKEELYEYPISTKYQFIHDIQLVDGVWILFT